jgi:hypothetical protein
MSTVKREAANNEVLYAAQWKREWNFFPLMGFNEQKKVNIDRLKCFMNCAEWDIQPSPDECSMRFCAKRNWNRSSLLDWAETYAKYLRYLWQIGGKKGIHQCATRLSMRVVNPLRCSQQKTSKDPIEWMKFPFLPIIRALDCSLSFSQGAPSCPLCRKGIPCRSRLIHEESGKKSCDVERKKVSEIVNK